MAAWRVPAVVARNRRRWIRARVAGATRIYALRAILSYFRRGRTRACGEPGHLTDVRRGVFIGVDPSRAECRRFGGGNERPDAAAESGAETARRERAVVARQLRHQDGFRDLVAEQL